MTNLVIFHIWLYHFYIWQETQWFMSLLTHSVLSWRRNPQIYFENNFPNRLHSKHLLFSTETPTCWPDPFELMSRNSKLIPSTVWLTGVMMEPKRKLNRTKIALDENYTKWKLHRMKITWKEDCTKRKLLNSWRHSFQTTGCTTEFTVLCKKQCTSSKLNARHLASTR